METADVMAPIKIKMENLQTLWLVVTSKAYRHDLHTVLYCMCADYGLKMLFSSPRREKGQMAVLVCILLPDVLVPKQAAT